MSETVTSASSGPCEVRIVYMSEAEEWAVYLQNVLRSSRKFRSKSVVLHPLHEGAALQDYEQELFRVSGSIVLLMSAAVLDSGSPEVLAAYQKAFHPPNKMVLLFCGVSENEMSGEYFQHWHAWRKLYADDEPARYISIVLDSINNASVSEPVSATAEPDCYREETVKEILPVPECDVTPESHSGDHQPPVSPPEIQEAQQGRDISPATQKQPAASVQEICLSIQPCRVQCGSQVTIFIILKSKMDRKSKAEVEFSCQDYIPKREPGNFENDYTISVKSPDMPSGTVLVSLFCNDALICSRPVTYFTSMGEVSSCLETVANPLDFLCQAFNITSGNTEALDKLLTDSLRSKIPATGLHVFGVSQVEEENMSAYQRNEELPTLLHFAAKFGLRMLATLLLQCPGALQAYSVANKYGDYPNSMAAKHGYSDLRQFMDEYVETADMLKSHMNDTMAKQEDGDLYEPMMMRLSLNSGCKEDIYESMMELDPDCMEDLYEDMDKALHQSLNPEDILLRKFFEGKADKTCSPETKAEDEREEGDEEEGEDEEEQAEEQPGGEVEDKQSWEEEDPYNMCFHDQIYDTVEEQVCYIPDVTNRPPAPIPRPSVTIQQEDNKTYISRVFQEKPVGHRHSLTSGGPGSVPATSVRLSTSTYDPYAGMRTPGQRQLISLQERVKVGAINVEEAVLEFKAWQQNQDMRAQSLRFQQENLKRLRDSISRRHKEKGKTGKDIEITSPLPQACMGEGWRNGSTSSQSSDGSNRLSTHSTQSFSSGADGDSEDTMDLPLPPRPPRSDPPPFLPPPRVPPRIPERIPENPVTDRYVRNPSRSLPRTNRRDLSPPPIPRRNR
ncbi:hypothetical protein GJAV_G00239000 [Gymnothorax javanicus]|nr:hypothetical protein GJAV_G00239000 [Gymnothorax javanicus]